MSTLITLIVVLGSILLIIAAIFAADKKDLILATVATSVISLIVSVFYYILQAPDVALTEAAIGVALTTIIFVVIIKNTKRFEE
jgi:uncharacterized MnhB-related membrane protein